MLLYGAATLTDACAVFDQAANPGASRRLLSSNQTTTLECLNNEYGNDCPEWTKGLEGWQILSVLVLSCCCVGSCISCCVYYYCWKERGDDEEEKGSRDTGSKMMSLTARHKLRKEEDAHRHTRNHHNRQESGLQDSSTVSGMVPAGRVGRALTWDDYSK